MHQAACSVYPPIDPQQRAAIERWRRQVVPIALTQPSPRFADEFATDYPLLQWERVLKEVDALGLSPEIRQRFLHDNAVTAFKLKV